MILENIYISSVLFSLLSFLMGSIPFGLVYGLTRGVDVRKVGSGNIGATNVGRLFGFWKGFIPVILLDILKGAIPVLLFKTYVISDESVVYGISEIVVALCAVLGHIFSPWIGFKGGKGVATSAGIVIALAPIVVAIELAIFLLVFLTFGKKIVGRSSVVALVFFPIVTYFTPNTTVVFQVFSIVLAILVIVAHKKNIQEWISGEDLKKKQAKIDNKDQ